MPSHTTFGGITLTLGRGGLRFKKRPSRFNLCIGRKLKGKAGPIHGGRYDKEWQEEFTRAVQECR